MQFTNKVSHPLHKYLLHENMARVCIGSPSSSENCGVLLLNGLEKKKKQKTVLWLKTLSPFHCIFDQWFLYAVVLPDKLGWLHFTTILKYIKKIYITKIKKKRFCFWTVTCKESKIEGRKHEHYFLAVLIFDHAIYCLFISKMYLVIILDGGIGDIHLCVNYFI